VDNWIHLVKIIDGDDVELDKLIAQKKVEKGEIENVNRHRQIELRVENEEYDKKEKDLYPVSNEIYLSPDNCFLFENSGIISIQNITKPMNHQANVVVGDVHPVDGQDEENNGGCKSNKSYDARNAEDALRRQRVEEHFFQ
jgi:hypothetical protein